MNWCRETVEKGVPARNCRGSARLHQVVAFRKSVTVSSSMVVMEAIGS